MGKVGAKALDIIKKQKAKSDEQGKGNSNLTFIGDGKTKFRMHWDHKDDEFVRELFYHNINKVKFLCTGSDCPLCKKAGVIDQNVTNSWRLGFAVKRVRMVWATITEIDYESKWVKLNEPTVLVFRPKLWFALIDAISGYDQTVMEEVFDVEKAGPLFSVDFKHGSNGVASVGFDIKRIGVEPLPKDHQPLSKVWIAADQQMDEEKLKEALVHMEEVYQARLKVQDPPENATEDAESTTATDDDLPMDPAPSTTPGDTGPAIPDDCPASFGQHPAVQPPECVMCPLESDCIAKTGA